MSDFDSTTIPVEELQAGRARDLLAEADVVIAVDAGSQEEEVVHGHDKLERAIAAGHEDALVVLRVELDMELDDQDWLIEAIQGGEDDEDDEHKEDGDLDD